jgi:hypothetical protein
MTERDVRRGLPSASMIFRLANCPGSLALTNELKRSGKYIEIPNPFAESGTRIHRWLYFDNAQPGEERAAIEEALTAAELRTAQKCAELKSELLNAWAGSADNEYKFLFEHRLWFRAGLWPRFSGQPDFVAIDRTNRRALILNFKTGRKEADESADNLQLRTEVVLLKHNNPELEEIQAAIVEPLVSWDSVRVQYAGEALGDAEKEILGIVDRAEREPQKRLAGTWCQYCQARVNCPEAANYVAVPWMGLKPAMFKDEGQNDEPFKPTREMIERAILDLPRGEPGVALWEKLKLAKKVIETLEKTYTAILQSEPGALPGYVLPAEGKERRVVPYPRKLKDALAQYLTDDEIDGAASFHLTKIQEVLGLKHHIEGKELEKLFDKLTSNAITIGHDAPWIRPMTKKEREQASKLIDARAAFGGPEPKQLAL